MHVLQLHVMDPLLQLNQSGAIIVKSIARNGSFSMTVLSE